MKQSSNLAEARSVDEQVNKEHEVHSGSVFLHDAIRSPTESLGAYILLCTGVFLQ